MTRRVIFSVGPESLAREGLRETPEIWEDGLRTDPRPGNFEWWYFDSQFEDGSTAVIAIYTKSILDRNSRLKPAVSLTITRPDGKKLGGLEAVPPADFSASKERCYVRAGASWVRGDLNLYELHAKAGDLVAQLNFTGVVPAWRPGSGKNYYDENLTRYFAWFPAIPYGTVEGHLIYDGKVHSVKGTCYHDHNWGNTGLNDVLSHWYWGRAHLGEYSLIFAEMTAAPRYGDQKLPVFMLAKGSQILTGDGEPLHLDEGEFIADSGGRSYPDGLNLVWKKDNDCVRLKLRDPQMIDSFSLLDSLPSWQSLVAHVLANPYYFRFHADLDLQVDLGDLHDHQQGRALYELMLLR